MTHQSHETHVAVPTLTEEELRALKNQSTQYLYSWVRDVANQSIRAKKSAAQSLLESFIGAATKDECPKVGAHVIHRHVYFEDEIRSNHSNQF